MADFDIQKLIGSPSLETMPEAVRDLMRDLLEGRVRQYAIVAELDDGNIGVGFHVVNEQDLNVYTMLGAIETLKRDYMDMEVPGILDVYQDMQDQGEDDDLEGE